MMIKGKPAAASVIAAFIMTAPSGSQARTPDDVQISPVRLALQVSDAAAAALGAKIKDATPQQVATNGWDQIPWRDMWIQAHVPHSLPNGALHYQYSRPAPGRRLPRR